MREDIEAGMQGCVWFGGSLGSEWGTVWAEVACWNSRVFVIDSKMLPPDFGDKWRLSTCCSYVTLYFM